MRTMWVVISGAYSDRNIECVFDTQEDAERAAALPGRWIYGTASVEAIDAYEPGDKVLKQNRAGFWGPYRSPDGRMGGDYA